MSRRDPTDERRRERLAGSTLASLLLHLLAAAFLISVVASSSQESASEATIGGQLVTIAQRVPVVARARKPAPAPARPQLRHAERLQRAPAVHRMRRPRAALHELTHVVPVASPNPTPVPTPQPLPEPTQAVAVAPPAPAPTTQPTPKLTPVPIPMPSVVPTAAPTPKPAQPTARPSAKPAQSAVPRIAPTAAPTRAPLPAASPAPRPSAAATPHAVASPVAKPNLPPSNQAGAPSPHPNVASSPASGHALPGPRVQNVGNARAKPRLITVAPTPSPLPRPLPRPAATRNPYAGLNARLNAMLPHGPVTPHMGHYVGSLSLSGRLEPTPPPAVLARTRFLYQGPGGGGDGTLKMWVTSVRRRGLVLICTGWILHFPQTIGQGILTAPNVPVGPVNGIQIGGPHQVPSGFAAGMAPIVVGIGSTECTQRSLTPFVPPAP